MIKSPLALKFLHSYTHWTHKYTLSFLYLFLIVVHTFNFFCYNTSTLFSPHIHTLIQLSSQVDTHTHACSYIYMYTCLYHKHNLTHLSFYTFLHSYTQDYMLSTWHSLPILSYSHIIRLTHRNTLIFIHIHTLILLHCHNCTLHQTQRHTSSNTITSTLIFISSAIFWHVTLLTLIYNHTQCSYLTHTDTYICAVPFSTYMNSH